MGKKNSPASAEDAESLSSGAMPPGTQMFVIHKDIKTHNVFTYTSSIQVVSEVVIKDPDAFLHDNVARHTSIAAKSFSNYVLIKRQVEAARRAQSATAKLQRAVDWFPSPRTRKVLVKMVADQEALIAKLMTDGRFKTARWQIGVTWVLIAYTGMLHLVASLMSAIRGKQRTN